MQRTYQRYFYTTWKGNPSSFLPPNTEGPTVVGGRHPLPPLMGDQSGPPHFKNRSRRQISACNVSTVRASEKSSIMTNRNSYMGFPVSYRWSAYITSKSPKGWLKKRTFPFFWNKSQLQLNEVWYKVSLRETSRGKVVVHSFPYRTVHRCSGKH